MKITLNSLNLTGGSIVDFNEKLIKVTSDVNGITYSSIRAGSNNFNEEQMKSIKSFINFVLPYISYNGRVLGLNAIKNIETVYGGSFGMTLTLEDIIIKVSTANNMDDKISHIKEISNLEYLFDKSVPVPETLNKYLGFISSKNYYDISKYNKYVGDLNIYTNLFELPNFTINTAELVRVNTNLNNINYLNNNILNNMVMIFLKKEDMSLSDFIRQNAGLSIKEKLSYAKDILTDLREALTFIHKTKKVIHCDIKPDNLVASRDAVTGKYKFKLIDFGSISKIRETGELNDAFPPMTPSFYTGTKHPSQLSYLYDYHCVILSILHLLGVTNINKLIEIYKKLSDFDNEDVTGELLILKFIEFINDKNPINLPNIDVLVNFIDPGDGDIINFYVDLIVLMKIASLQDKYTPLESFYV